MRHSSFLHISAFPPRFLEPISIGNVPLNITYLHSWSSSLLTFAFSLRRCEAYIPLSSALSILLFIERCCLHPSPCPVFRPFVFCYTINQVKVINEMRRFTASH